MWTSILLVWTVVIGIAHVCLTIGTITYVIREGDASTLKEVQGLRNIVGLTTMSLTNRMDEISSIAVNAKNMTAAMSKDVDHLKIYTEDTRQDLKERLTAALSKAAKKGRGR